MTLVYQLVHLLKISYYHKKPYVINIKMIHKKIERFSDVALGKLIKI